MRTRLILAPVAALCLAIGGGRADGEAVLTAVAVQEPAPRLQPPPPPGGFSPAEMGGLTQYKDHAWILVAARWPRPKAIPVCWEPGADAMTQEKGWVKDAIDRSWDAASDEVRFFGWGTCGTNAVGIRIAIREVGASTIGLGTQLDSEPGGMTLNFTFVGWRTECRPADKRESCIRTVAVHEFGHALGFAHEHNRWDTPGECAIAPEGTNGDHRLTPWDPESEMNYCNEHADGVLSPRDIEGLRLAYPSA